jgi:hypothetical protein
MRIIIEDNSIEWELPEKNVLLRQIIEEMETFLLTVGKVPIALIIDGESLTQGELEKRQEESVTGDEVLEFGVMNLTDFVIENLQGAKEANTTLVGLIETFADELYSSTKSVEPQEVIEDLRNFFFFWFRINSLFPLVFEGIDFDGSTLDERIGQLQDLFKEIVEAMEEEDVVLAADLLQYEVSPVIEVIGASIPILEKKIHTMKAEYEEAQETEKAEK